MVFLKLRRVYIDDLIPDRTRPHGARRLLAIGGQQQRQKACCPAPSRIAVMCAT